MKTPLVRITGILGFLLATHGSALACAACWGDTSGSKTSQAATAGIFAMVVIMFLMLGAVGAFGYYLNYRAKHPLPDYDEMTGDLPNATPEPPRP
jgi:hypothetical protein